jgi:hypothetical protein
MTDLLVKQSEALTNFQQWATSFAVEATKALEPLKTATATITDMWQPFREAAALLSSGDYATSLTDAKATATIAKCARSKFKTPTFKNLCQVLKVNGPNGLPKNLNRRTKFCLRRCVVTGHLRAWFANFIHPIYSRL